MQGINQDSPKSKVTRESLEFAQFFPGLDWTTVGYEMDIAGGNMNRKGERRTKNLPRGSKNWLA